MRTPKPLRLRALPSRGWSVRAKIVSLLLIPLVALVAMWGLATFVTLGPGLDLVRTRSDLTSVARPADALRTELQTERKLSVTYLAETRRDAAALVDQRVRTDHAVEEFRRLAGADTAHAAASLDRIAALLTSLDGLDRLRSSVDRAEVDRLGALRQYTDLINAVDLVYASVAVSTDPVLTTQAHGLVDLARGRELLAQEDALVSGALAAGTLSAIELGQTVQTIGAQRYAFASALPELYPPDRDRFTAMTGADPFTRLAALENRVVANAKAGAPVPVDASGWASAYDDAATKLREFEARATQGVVDRGSPAAAVIFTRIGIAGLLGLVTVLVTIVATVRVGRSIIKRLASLRQAALEMSIDRLPRVVRRLRLGEEVDVAHEAPPLPYGDDEIGQVGRAFNELQRTAVNSAVDEANVRRGLNEVFLNIARRSQTLLHRQLSILDRMERRTNDPTELEDLFRVDHLATRMRRHAEDLVILAGAAPGRGWRNPVPLVDVLRGAVSEVEDYARVSVRPVPEVAIAGRAVGDLIHLLAELIENATSFSPPNTKVNVGAEPVAHGFAVEIEDRGLGMSPAAMAEVNARLADPPEFDPANSAQLGLFVVARLAARHGIRVQLRASPYGGVTAVALVPDDVVVTPGALPAPRVPAALTAGPNDVTAVIPAYRDATYEPGPYDPAAAPRGNGDAGRRDLTTAQPRVIAVPAEVEDDDELIATEVGPDEVVTGGPVLATEARTRTSTKHAPSGKSDRAVPRHSRQEVIEAPASDGPDGLPRRVRQSSLAPQLREAPPPVQDEPASPPTRSPEQLRAMMTSFQSGMNRGRRDAGPDADPDVAGESERNAERDAL